MDDIMRNLERGIVKKLCQEMEIPEEIWLMIDCLIKNGCPTKAVLKGMQDYSEEVSKKHDVEALKELLKDLPIKWEE